MTSRLKLKVLAMIILVASSSTIAQHIPELTTRLASFFVFGYHLEKPIVHYSVFDKAR